MIRVVVAQQLMCLQKLRLKLKVPHLCSELVVLIEIRSLPLVVKFSLSYSLANWLSLTRIVGFGYSGCSKEVFKPFLMTKAAGTVSVFSLPLNRLGSHESKSAKFILCPMCIDTAIEFVR